MTKFLETCSHVAHVLQRSDLGVAHVHREKVWEMLGGLPNASASQRIVTQSEKAQGSRTACDLADVVVVSLQEPKVRREKVDGSQQVPRDIQGSQIRELGDVVIKLLNEQLPQHEALEEGLHKRLRAQISIQRSKLLHQAHQLNKLFPAPILRNKLDGVTCVTVQPLPRLEVTRHLLLVERRGTHDKACLALQDSSERVPECQRDLAAQHRGRNATARSLA
mmetsp:Transcript_61171/g.162548  ORF Transcript_61171/g.162548 Transcript_61171/m.162548 type:complete len:221 (-) Transcript_61171:30-692(-)